MTLGGYGYGPRYDIPGHARFLTFSCRGREPLFSDVSTRDTFAEHLEFRRHRYRLLLFAWVIMPEHVHLVVLPPAQGVTRRFVEQLKTGFSRRTLRQWRQGVDSERAHDHRVFWEVGGGYDRLLRQRRDLDEKINYVHRNPVRRGLVERPSEWVWSSARWYEGDRSGPVTIDLIP